MLVDTHPETVLSDPSSVGLYGVVIKHKNPTLGVGIYDKILRDSKSEPWTNILEHDVVIITSTVSPVTLSTTKL